MAQGIKTGIDLDFTLSENGFEDDDPVAVAECVCDGTPLSRGVGHKNSSGGYCCPHWGNTCGLHPEYR